MNPIESTPLGARPPRLLVIEDAAPWRRRMGDLLRGALRGEVEEVTDAYSALRLTQANPNWDLVVIDLDLAGMNGFELYFRLREAVGEPLAVIFTTSLPAPGWVRVDAPRESRVVQKPVEAAEFIGLVRRELVGGEEHAAGGSSLCHGLSGSGRMMAVDRPAGKCRRHFPLAACRVGLHACHYHQRCR